MFQISSELNFPQILRVDTSLIKALASASILSIKRLILPLSTPSVKSRWRKNLLGQTAYQYQNLDHNDRI